MPKLRGLVVDSVRSLELARFWAGLLGWEVIIPADETADESAHEVVLRAPPPDGCEVDLVFAPVRDSGGDDGDKEVKNRLHLDLASYSLQDQVATIDRAIALGAQRRDIGQGAVPWEVLIDPEGNEFCVLEPRPGYATTGAIAAIVVDSLEPPAIAAFWATITGWRILRRESVIVGMRPAGGRGPWLEFLRTAEPKRRPNSLCLEIAGEDPDRLRELGARIVRAEPLVGTVQLVDPEGNEFLLSSR